MKMKIRSKLTFGFLIILVLGSVVSLTVLRLLSGTIKQLNEVITVSDVIEKKGVELRLDLSSKSDALRGYMLDPSDGSEKERRDRVSREFEEDITEIQRLSPEGDIFKIAQTVKEYEKKSLIPLE